MDIYTACSYQQQSTSRQCKVLTRIKEKIKQTSILLLKMIRCKTSTRTIILKILRIYLIDQLLDINLFKFLNKKIASLMNKQNKKQLSPKIKKAFYHLIIKISEVRDQSIPNIKSKKNKQRMIQMKMIFSDARNLNRTGKKSMKEKVCLNKTCSDLNSEPLGSIWQSNFLMKTILTDTKNSLISSFQNALIQN